jgi:hypothetical protein
MRTGNQRLGGAQTCCKFISRRYFRTRDGSELGFDIPAQPRTKQIFSLRKLLAQIREDLMDYAHEELARYQNRKRTQWYQGVLGKKHLDRVMMYSRDASRRKCALALFDSRPRVWWSPVAETHA